MARDKQTWLQSSPLARLQPFFFNTSGEQFPDDISLFRRSLALRCIIIPARAASTDIGGRPRPAGGCTTGGSGALAFCVTVYQSGLSSLSPLTYAPLGRSSPSYAGPPPSVEALPRG